MGNRAVITASTSKTKGTGIYLHWNGGIESVLAFFDVARMIKYRSPGSDGSYAMGRLCGLICLALDIRADTGVGIGSLTELDCNNYDNGVYVVGDNWELVDRWGEGSEPVTPQAIADARASTAYQQLVDHIISRLDVTETV